MRNVIIICASLLSISSTAYAQTPYFECMKGTPKETKADNSSVSAMLAYSKRFSDYVDHCQKTFIEPRSAPSSDVYHDYEIDSWKVDQQNKSDMEAVNRDNNLRRADLLPW